MEDNSYIFNMDQPSQNQIIPKQISQSNQTITYQNFEYQTQRQKQPIQPQIVYIKPQYKQLSNTQRQDIIVFDYDQEQQNQNHKNQKISFQKKIKKFKKQFQKQISTQQQVTQDKSQIKDNDLILNPQDLQSSLRNIQHQNISQQISDFGEEELDIKMMLPIYQPKTKIMQTKSNFYVQQILFFPRKFHLFIEQKHRLTARIKIFHSTSLYYFFSNQEDLSTKGPFYVGYMESNFNGTQYSIFTNEGINLAHFKYVLSEKQLLSLKIYIPKKFYSKNKKTIMQRYRQNDQNIIIVNNKKPTYSSVTKRYSLNFRGRAKMPSIKNCVCEINNEYCLIFGKQKQRHYALDFGGPLSQLTAFGLCVSNYEDKLGFSRQ